MEVTKKNHIHANLPLYEAGSEQNLEMHLFNSGQELFIAKKVTVLISNDIDTHSNYEPVKLLLASPASGYFYNAILPSQINPKPQFYNDHYLQCCAKTFLNYCSEKITGNSLFFRTAQFKEFNYSPNRQCVVCIQQAYVNDSNKIEMGVWIIKLKENLWQVDSCYYFKFPRNWIELAQKNKNLEITNTGTQIILTNDDGSYFFSVPTYSYFRTNSLVYTFSKDKKE